MVLNDLHTTELGEGERRVVFLHGLFGQGKNWTSIAKQLADSYRILLVDQPHHGKSGWADDFAYGDMADAVGLTQPTVSHHLKVLVEAGLLTREKRGTWAWFALVPERVAEVATLVD